MSVVIKTPIALHISPWFLPAQIRLGSVSYGIESPASDDEKLKDMQQSSVECLMPLLWRTNGEENPSSPFSSFFILISKKRSICTRVSGSQNLQASEAVIIFIPGNYDQQELLKGFDVVVVGLSCLSYDFELAAKIDETCRSLGRITATTAYPPCFCCESKCFSDALQRGAGFMLTVAAGELAFFFSDLQEHVMQVWLHGDFT